MSGSMLAFAVAIVGLAITALWFGLSRRRKSEIEIGIQSLARMKWRECLMFILEALEREGYRQSTETATSGSGGTELLLTQGNEQVLLGYKHGTAYRLGDAQVREFAHAMPLHGAQRGILVTLGSAEATADAVASLCNVQLLDGSLLWNKVRPFIEPVALEQIREQAAARTRKGIWAGAAASLVAGGAIYLLSSLGGPFPALTKPTGSPQSSAADSAQAVTRSEKTIRSDAAMLNQIKATEKAMEAVAKLSGPELAKRRAAAARDVDSIPQVQMAAWSAQSTLLVTLNKTDGQDKVLGDEMCRILTQYEELRFTRIQIEAPTDSGQAVRWRLCN